MTTLQAKMQTLNKLGKYMGVEISWSPTDLYLYSPYGYRFNVGNGTHVHVYPHRGINDWKREVITEALEDLQHGLSKCPITCDCKEKK